MKQSNQKSSILPAIGATGLAVASIGVVWSLNNVKNELYETQTLLIDAQYSWETTRNYLNIAEREIGMLGLEIESLQENITDLELSKYELKQENIELGKNIAVLRSEIARRRANVTNAEVRLLSQVLYHESRGECRDGQKAIVHTLVNRLHDDRWGDSITEIVFEPNQISHVHQVPHRPVQDKLIEVVLEALNEPDITNGAYFWWHEAIATNRWLETRTPVSRFGNHTFLK